MKQTEVEYKVNVLGSQAPNREKYQKQLDELIKLALSGDLLPIELTDISEQLTIARKKYTTSKVSPETRKLASEKAGQTRKAQAEVHILRQEVISKFQIVSKSLWEAVFPNPNDPKVIGARTYWKEEVYPMLKAKYPLANELFIKHF